MLSARGREGSWRVDDLEKKIGGIRVEFLQLFMCTRAIT